jgi:hypothetical protein
MYGRATSEDLQTEMENASGMDLDFYFDQWVYDEYFPQYKYNYLNEPGSDISYISLKQTQEDYNRRPLFEMPVQLKLFLQDGSDTLVTVWNDLKIQTFQLELDADITFIQFDPDGWLLDMSEYDPELIVGFHEILPAITLQVNPVPASGWIDISTSIADETSDIEILNSIGRTIIHKKWNENQGRLNIADLAAGVYFVKLTNDKGSAVKKFVKQ